MMFSVGSALSTCRGRAAQHLASGLRIIAINNTDSQQQRHATSHAENTNIFLREVCHAVLDLSVAISLHLHLDRCRCLHDCHQHTADSTMGMLTHQLTAALSTLAHGDSLLLCVSSRVVLYTLPQPSDALSSWFYCSFLANFVSAIHSTQALTVLEYPEKLQRLLLTPQREMAVELVVQMDNGEVEVFNGYRVQVGSTAHPTPCPQSFLLPLCLILGCPPDALTVRLSCHMCLWANCPVECPAV